MHINKKNKNLYSEYKNLVNLYNESGKIFLTGNKDVDYQILYNLDNVKDISKVCRINKYTQELCDKNFWIAKFKNENLNFIIDPDQLDLKEWLLLYRNSKIAAETAKYALKIYDMFYTDDSIKIKVITNHEEEKQILSYIYNLIKHEDIDNIHKIEVTYNENNYRVKLFYNNNYRYNNYRYENLTRDEIMKLLHLSYVYSYPLARILKVTCNKISLIVDDRYLGDYDLELDEIDDEDELERVKIMFARHGILETLKKL